MHRSTPGLSLFIAAALTACAPGQPYRTTGEQPLEEAIAKAKTKADHEALAVRYEQKAEALLAKAKQHQRIAGYYGEYGGRLLVRKSLMEHYLRLAANYREAAEENLSLARLHRQLATQTPP